MSLVSIGLGNCSDSLSVSVTSLSQIARLRREVQHVQNTLLHSEASQAAAQQQLSASAVVHAELMAKVTALEGEKANSIERSTAMEKSLTMLQATCTQLLEENKRLKALMDGFSSRSWQSNSEVSACTGCSKQFTVNRRRHHCRHCGKIFCQACSSQTAHVAAIKKPVRVCDPCHADLT